MEAFGYQRTVIGYHGCDQSVVDSIINRNGHLKRSENRYDWLGKGIYFWEFGPSRANEWAIQRVKDGSKTIKVPAVLGAIINLGRCFDLLDVANTHLLSEMYPPFERFMEKNGKVLPRNISPENGDPHDLVLRYLDCAMVNWALSMLELEGVTFDTVRCVFTEGGPAFRGSKIQHQSHIQIAVRNPASIVGYFLPSRAPIEKI